MRQYANNIKPGRSRWPSRDPLDEAGGVNLFGFVGNVGVQDVDPLGLWILKRDNDAKADAIAEDGDTIDSLAVGLRLDTTDWASWAKVNDVSSPYQKLTCDTIVSIPNTIYIDLGSDDKGINGSQVIELWQKAAPGLKRAYENLGFKVVLTQPTSVDEIKTHLKTDGIYGYFFYGHGAGTGSLVSEGNTFTPQRLTTYGIAFAEIWACDSGGKIFNRNAKYKYNEWELNIAVRGYFLGLGNLISMNVPPVFVKTPGVNAK